MDVYIGKICPYCKTAIKPGEPATVCPSCGIPHHTACWQENGGCTTFGCVQRHEPVQRPAPSDRCGKCGSPIPAESAFCPHCGAPKAAVTQKRFCGKCGTELQPGQSFCPKCGHKADLQMDAGVSSAISQFNAGVQKANVKKQKRPLVIGIAAGVVALAVLLIIVLSAGKKNFKKMYSDLADEPWCTIASDGSYLKIDTNPTDKDSEDLTRDDLNNTIIPADDAIMRINADLGFSENVYERMDTTTWSMGEQTVSNEDYVVTWTYHPDMGLEVTYRFK